MSDLGLKDFLSPGGFSYPVNQRVETDILFPVSKSQQSVKFIFDKKGILDNNSKIRLKLLKPFYERRLKVLYDSRAYLRVLAQKQESV